jgi:hypothetical protein
MLVLLEPFLVKTLPGFELGKYRSLSPYECLRFFGSLETVRHGILIGSVEAVEKRLCFLVFGQLFEKICRNFHIGRTIVRLFPAAVFFGSRNSH